MFRLLIFSFQVYNYYHIIPRNELILMKETYTVHYNRNLDKEYSKDLDVTVEEVGECPCCHFASSPRYLDGFLIASQENDIQPTAYLTLYCTRCHSIYIAKYIGDIGITNLKLDFVFPQQVNYKKFSDNINELSQNFVSIYNQALESESNVSTQGLAGLGYRKSLEFLIKDYLITVKKQSEDAIKELDLAKCIDKLDDDLKEIAKASAWIGNDETHYFRKNPQYDISDLKSFIDCLVLDIDSKYCKWKAKQLVKSK